MSWYHTALKIFSAGVKKQQQQNLMYVGCVELESTIIQLEVFIAKIYFVILCPECITLLL